MHPIKCEMLLPAYRERANQLDSLTDGDYLLVAWSELCVVFSEAVESQYGQRISIDDKSDSSGFRATCRRIDIDSEGELKWHLRLDEEAITAQITSPTFAPDQLGAIFDNVKMNIKTLVHLVSSHQQAGHSTTLVIDNQEVDIPAAISDIPEIEFDRISIKGRPHHNIEITESLSINLPEHRKVDAISWTRGAFQRLTQLHTLLAPDISHPDQAETPASKSRRNSRNRKAEAIANVLKWRRKLKLQDDDLPLLIKAGKPIRPTDESKQAYLPDKEQRDVLEAAGYLPGMRGDPPIPIRNAATGRILCCSYYKSLRKDGRPPETRLGKDMIHELIQGHVGRELWISFDGMELTASLTEPDEYLYESIYESITDVPNNLALRLMVARLIRSGQPKFRQAQIALWKGRCAVSGHGPTHALDAAHIRPYAVHGINDPDNGLLLRADIHKLLDADLLSIQSDGSGPVIHIDERIRDEPYGEYHGQRLRVRSDGSPLPNTYL